MREITVVYHEEDGLWWAESDDVPGWAAGGDSLKEARERVAEGLDFFLGEEVAIDERFPSMLGELHVHGHEHITISVDASVTTGVTMLTQFDTGPVVIGPVPIGT